MSKDTYSNIFEPPEDFFGQICVASALSADESFIENALCTFTKSDNNGRAFDRCHSFFLMLNKGHSILSKSISGLCQLEPSSPEDWSKVAVQHAKVAIMQFGQSRMRKEYSCDDETVWRLVVCTGNWTEESAKNQIEMVWQIDVNHSKYDDEDAYDLLLAARFLKNLRKLYVCNKLFWNRAQQMLDAIDGKFSHIHRKNSRFISTLPNFSDENGNDFYGITLWKQIADRFNKCCGKFNRLIVGSGFYEQCRNSSKSAKPKVLSRIENDLKDKALISHPEKRLVVNEDNAGQIVTWRDRDWDVYKPFDFSEKNRKLHAKYIFIGKNFKGKIKSGMMYMGSGNLSIMGVLSAYGKVETSIGSGNIEAGVVFPTMGVLPIDENDLVATLACSSDCNAEFDEKSSEGADIDDPKWSFIFPSPLQAIKKISGSGKFEFIWGDFVSESEIQVSFATNVKTVDVICKNELQYEWGTWDIHEKDLSQWIKVIINGEPYQIPIVSEDGLLIESKKTLANPTEWLDFLDNFPQNAEKIDGEDNLDPRPEPNPDGSSRNSSKSSESDVHFDFPYQDAMKIVEGLAVLNNRYFPQDGSKSNAAVFLDDWIFQIDNSVKCFPESFVNKMKGLGIDFLSVLKNKEGFAPTLNSELQSKWNKFIDSWIMCWELPQNNKIWEEPHD